MDLLLWKKAFLNKIVIIPTYNEAGNIGLLINNIFGLGINISVLVIDDNSPDGTSNIVRKLQEAYPNLYMLIRENKMGLGRAYTLGFNYALKNGYDIVIQMDADLSHDPNYLIPMINLLEGNDLVIGSRYVEGGGVKDRGYFRALLSRCANFFCRHILKLPISDITSGFKCMGRKVLEGINCNPINSEGYAFQIEMARRVYLAGFRIIEYPILFKERSYGKSKMDFSVIIEAILKLVSLSTKDR